MGRARLEKEGETTVGEANETLEEARPEEKGNTTVGEVRPEEKVEITMGCKGPNLLLEVGHYI